MPLDLSKIKALCFDVDGTLGDTDDLWVQKLEKKLNPLRFLFPGHKVRPFARWSIMSIETPGNLVYHLLDRLQLDDEITKLFNYMARRNMGRKPHHYQLIPDVAEALITLHRHFPISVVSARDENSTLAFLDQFDLKKLFDPAIATAQTCSYTKPYPDPILWAADRMGVKPAECLMIGDTTVDIRAGIAAGAQTVGVLCGFGRRNELERAGADLIIPSPSLLPSILTTNGSET